MVDKRDNIYDSDWLDQLSHHELFDLSISESKRLTDLRLGSQQQTFNFSKNSVNNTSNLNRRTHLLALRDSDLFVAVGSQIRVLNLTEFKDAWTEANDEAFENDINEVDTTLFLNLPYKVLDTPEIDFDIDTILPNKNGTLLAAVGEKKLVVICLPRQGFTNAANPNVTVLSQRKITCKCLSIGKNVYTEATRFLKVSWHPLSETRTHLVVLTNDSILSIFDISRDVNDAEQLFDLASSQRKTVPKVGIHALDVINDDEEVVSYSLGGISHDTSGWETFTLYYTLKNGLIYALCPVLPFRSIVKRKHLESLACLSDAKCNKILSTTEKDGEINPIYYYFRLQYQWIYDMLESSRKQTKSSFILDNDHIVIKSDESSIPLQTQPQGPFIVKQTNNQSENLGQVSDMLLLQTDDIRIMALTYTNGYVQNYILGGGISGQWIMPKGKTNKNTWQKMLSNIQASVEFLPRASIYETIHFDKTQQLINKPMWLIEDPLYNDTYYVYHSAGIHTISTKSWVDELLKLKSDIQAGSNVIGAKQKESTSKIRCIVNTAPVQSQSSNPIIGCTIIVDNYLSYSLLSLDANYKLIGVDLILRKVSEQAEELKKQLSKSDNATDQNTTTTEEYRPILSLEPFTIPKSLEELNNASGSSKVVIPKEMGGDKEVVITNESLLFLSTTSTKIRKDIRDISKSAALTEARLKTQKHELIRQLDTVSKLYQRVLDYNSAMAPGSPLMQKIETAQQTHAQLSRRIDKLFRMISQAKQLELSDNEKDWINRLTIINLLVNGDSKTERAGYIHRIEKLKSIIEENQKNTSKPSPIQRKTSKPISDAQASSIHHTLDIQTKYVNNIVDRMEEVNTLFSQQSLQ
ncbi:hypothetical protein BJ944DRAFT_247092 [Cunninghamella echinulata]|nr:hypothetical protein BJ944DRAFT_247092 [Cunninghamella echinulata]